MAMAAVIMQKPNIMMRTAAIMMQMAADSRIANVSVTMMTMMESVMPASVSLKQLSSEMALSPADTLPMRIMTASAIIMLHLTAIMAAGIIIADKFKI